LSLLDPPGRTATCSGLTEARVSDATVQVFFYSVGTLIVSPSQTLLFLNKPAPPCWKLNRMHTSIAYIPSVHRAGDGATQVPRRTQKVSLCTHARTPTHTAAHLKRHTRSYARERFFNTFINLSLFHIRLPCSYSQCDLPSKEVTCLSRQCAQVMHHVFDFSREQGASSLHPALTLHK
jgi:hypothetical protein